MVQVFAAMEKLLPIKQLYISINGIINKKAFTKMRFRIIPPPEGMTPGVESIKIYVNQLEKGTTSPAAWGYPCPVLDALEKFKCGASIYAKEEMYNSIRVSREYWFPGIDQEDPGTPENPKIQIFPSPQRIYQQIIEQLIGDGKDEDDESNDITDVHEGQDVRIRKEGSGKDTKWHAKFLNPAPISKDANYVAAVVELSKNFNVRDHFFRVDAKVLQQAYTLVSGKKGIPQIYMEGIGACSRPGATPIVPKQPEVRDPGIAKLKTRIVIGKTRVTFVRQTQGLVTGELKDEDGNQCYVVTGDMGETWTVPKSDVKVFLSKVSTAEVSRKQKPPKSSN